MSDRILELAAPPAKPDGAGNAEGQTVVIRAGLLLETAPLSRVGPPLIICYLEQLKERQDELSARIDKAES